MNLLLLAKQVKESHFFPKKLSEVAAAASSAVLNLRGTLASLSCWAMAGITGCFILCHLPKGGDRGCKVPLGFWQVVKKDAELLLISCEWGFRGVRRVQIFLLLCKGLLGFQK